MNTSIIKHVTISKLWGIKTISTDFDEHVNIFIGINGSSKTTFLSLIEATLLVDLKVFFSIDFKYIKIDFLGNDIKTLTVTKQEYYDGDFLISYHFDNDEPISVLCSDFMLKHSFRMPMKFKESYLSIKERVKNLVNISWLSVNRDNFNHEDSERYDFENIKNMVDAKLQELVKKLLVFQLQLESEANKDSLKFKEEALSLMLYNPSFDNFNEQNLKIFESTDTDSMKRDLYKAFSKLGVAKDKSELIQGHINKIKDSISRISSRPRISFEDVFVLSLINRTMSIIEISKEHEINATKIFDPLTQFLKCLKDFMPNKTFKLGDEEKGNLIIELFEYKVKKSPIDITSLSSGEKQLFILWAESLLQNKSSQLFITDEPELSLHISWQRIIIEKILEINPNAQIIVATHSPEIAGKFPNNIINMSKITYYD